jgi:Zn-dependent peptidase ImmA (M78 family)
METEANLIAANILMPEHTVISFFNEEKTIEEMSRLFSVSAEAISIRLVTLGLMRATGEIERVY